MISICLVTALLVRRCCPSPTQIQLCGVSISVRRHRVYKATVWPAARRGERDSHCCSPRTRRTALNIHKYSHNFNFRESVPHLLILLFFDLLILFDEGVRQWRGCVDCIHANLAAARVSKEQVRIMAFPIINKRKKGPNPCADLRQDYERSLAGLH